jgi:hypothetical protein
VGDAGIDRQWIARRKRFFERFVEQFFLMLARRFLRRLGARGFARSGFLSCRHDNPSPLTCRL